MNLLLFDASQRLDGTRIRLAGRTLSHLREVHRADVGKRLRVGEIGGLIGEGVVEHIDTECAELNVQLEQPPPAKLPVSLVVALPRPKMLRRILRSVAEFGARELHLINSYRVEKSYWQTPVLAPESIRNYLLLGLEQGCDTVLPQVHLHRRFRPWVEDELPTLSKGKRALVAHPGDYPPCPSQLTGETLLVIGPEGGFIPFEVECFNKAGCDMVNLGPRILRTETAAIAATASL